MKKLIRSKMLMVLGLLIASTANAAEGNMTRVGFAEVEAIEKARIKCGSLVIDSTGNTKQVSGVASEKIPNNKEQSNKESR